MSTSQPTTLEALANAPIPTRQGEFEMHVFRYDDPAAHSTLSTEHVALVMGDVAGGERVPVRVHSECLTSEVFGSLKCDCKEQLERSKQEIARRGRGVVLYLRQEGRGIGLANKVKAYALQARGADTIEANELLHLPVDARNYSVAKAMLEFFQIHSIELMTNNPLKVEGLRDLGVDVVGRLPILIAANQHSLGYLDTKRRLMRHAIPETDAREAAGAE